MLKFYLIVRNTFLKKLTLDNNIFIFFLLFLTYILMSYNMITLYFHLPDFHVSNKALFFA